MAKMVVTLTSIQTAEEQRKALETALRQGFEVLATIRSPAMEQLPDRNRPGRQTPRTIAVTHVILEAVRDR